MRANEIKTHIRSFLRDIFKFEGVIDVYDLERHLFEDVLDLEANENIIARLQDDISELQEERNDLSNRADIVTENLREELIIERFEKLFNLKDYKALEAMLDMYDLI